MGPDANGPGGAIAATAAAALASNRRYAPDALLPVPGASGGGGGPAGTGAKPAALRCLRVSPCGRHLAAGDARGNLRVFSLVTLQLVMLKEAHDAEILSLDYSAPSLDGVCYLASSSRDMLVHVYDMSRGYELVGTCDAHSGAVTAVRFSAHGGLLALLSCSADKSVVFRWVLGRSWYAASQYACREAKLDAGPGRQLLQLLQIYGNIILQGRPSFLVLGEAG